MASESTVLQSPQGPFVALCQQQYAHACKCGSGDSNVLAHMVSAAVAVCTID